MADPQPERAEARAAPLPGSEPAGPRPPRPRTPAEQMAFVARLAGGLAHEVKNPLSTMSINLALLEEEWSRGGAGRPGGGEPSPREQRSLKRLKTLKREVERLERIVEEFLHYARGGQINRAPSDLAALVRELLEFVDPQDAQLGIRHHVDLPLGLPLVMVDESAFKQAIMNLLVNARQAMPGGGELMVRMTREGNWVALSITDTGIGMSPQKLERCFDEYWSDKKGGTGLGLPTARRIVEDHGGTIAVVSEEGRGTSFTIYLPLIVELTGSASRHEEREAHARAVRELSHGAQEAEREP